MDDRRRDPDAGQPDPTQDSWSAWLPQLDSPSAPPQEQPAPDPPVARATPARPGPPVPPAVPRLPQASLRQASLPHAAPAPTWVPVSPPRAYAGRSAAPPQPGSQPFGPPPNRLGAAILCTILCFMPFGIVALVKAASVNTLWARGRFEEAHRASRSARTWCMLAALVSPVLPVLTFGLVFVFTLAHMLT
ncbi:CD225/dispanin family protein [Terrabacter sp. NPDC080008]|uniref:CD225/dispanin family protein n=1 Tax=Terrabacter sp. NPDC080008 TaxID=3155176 RepID=UPI00344C0217